MFKKEIIFNPDRELYLEQLELSSSILISYRANHKLKILFFVICTKDYYLVYCNYSKEYYLDLILLADNIKLFDFKKFCYFYQTSFDLIKQQLEKFVDLKFIFSRQHTKCSSLEDCFKLDLPYEEVIHFYSLNNNLDSYNKPYQLLTNEGLLKNLLAEVNFLLEKSNHPIQHNHISLLFNEVSLIYSSLEITNILVTSSLVDKYFVRFCRLKSGNMGNIRYELFNSTTERIYSKFHLMKKEERKSIICTKDVFISFDFINFETKLLLDFLTIVNREKDIYAFMANLSNGYFSREKIKELFFKCMYGGIINHQEKDFFNKNVNNLVEKIEQFKSLYLGSKSYVTRWGKEILFDSNEEINNRLINAEIQNTASLFMHFIVSKLYLKMKEQGMKSCLVATVVDEVIIDAAKEELESVISLVKEVININPFVANKKYVDLLPQFKLGKNLGELY